MNSEGKATNTPKKTGCKPRLRLSAHKRGPQQPEAESSDVPLNQAAAVARKWFRLASGY